MPPSTSNISKRRSRRVVTRFASSPVTIRTASARCSASRSRPSRSLRDPVERTLSVLRQARSKNPRAQLRGALRRSVPAPHAHRQPHGQDALGHARRHARRSCDLCRFRRASPRERKAHARRRGWTSSGCRSSSIGSAPSSKIDTRGTSGRRSTLCGPNRRPVTEEFARTDRTRQPPRRASCTRTRRSCGASGTRRRSARLRFSSPKPSAEAESAGAPCRTGSSPTGGRTGGTATRDRRGSCATTSIPGCVRRPARRARPRASAGSRSASSGRRKRMCSGVYATSTSRSLIVTSTLRAGSLEWRSTTYAPPWTTVRAHVIVSELRPIRAVEQVLEVVQERPDRRGQRSVARDRHGCECYDRRPQALTDRQVHQRPPVSTPRNF